ncbi:hypothetical protein C8J57DRAFT_1282461 [Mycena rebaudengoi]|nr:hypothetical protein C8J57DRAFT_1282461 [Mycena rebaudengoi]
MSRVSRWEYAAASCWELSEPIEEWPRDPNVRPILARIFQVPDELKRIGGMELKECLRRLWVTAVEYGREDGYSAGFRDGMEHWKQIVATERAAPTSTSSTPTCVASVSTASQTDIDPIPHPTPVTPPAVHSVSIQTDLISAQTEPPPCTSRFDIFSPPATPPPPSLSTSLAQLFACDPIPPFFDCDYSLKSPLICSPSTSPPSPRDFSALRSGTSRPFGSLQRRSRRAPRSLRTRQSGQRPFVLHIHTRHDDLFQRAAPRSKRDSYAPFSPSTPVLSQLLDWDRDPRLRGLSRALTALGWCRSA